MGIGGCGGGRGGCKSGETGWGMRVGGGRVLRGAMPRSARRWLRPSGGGAKPRPAHKLLCLSLQREPRPEPQTELHLPWNPRATGVWTPPPSLGLGCFAGKLSKCVPQPLRPAGSLRLRISYSDFPAKDDASRSCCDSPLLECIAVLPSSPSERRKQGGALPPQAGLEEAQRRQPATHGHSPPHLTSASPSFCQDAQTPSSEKERPCSARHGNSRPQNPHPHALSQPVGRRRWGVVATHLHRHE